MYPCILAIVMALVDTSGHVALQANAATAKRPSPQHPRVLLITAQGNARCEHELARLRRADGDFDLLRQAGWKIGTGEENHLQVVDEAAIPDLIQRLGASDFPIVVCIEGAAIVRSFKSGCTTPLDRWTIGFLFKGVDERPPGAVKEAAKVATTGNYPLRGNHWSIDEDWRPTKERVIGHLRGPAHGHQIRASQAIETWSYEELRSLHDNLHEIEMGGVSASYSRSQRTDTLSAGRKTKW